MQIKNISSNDGIQLTYYLFGNSQNYNKTIIILNAPGMSIKFWVPIVETLMQEFRIIAFDYRGFPYCEKELQEEECHLDFHIDDVELILCEEKIHYAHFLSWCLGSKVMMGYYKKNPSRVLSMVGLNIVYHKVTSENVDSFSQFMFDCSKRIKQKPQSIETMICLMKNVGSVPTVDFLTKISSEDEDSPILNLYDLLDSQSSFSNLAFYLIDKPNGLKTYLKMFNIFTSIDFTATIRDIAVPFYILAGSKDLMTPLTENDEKLYRCNNNITIQLIDNGSHFMLIEYPAKISRLIRESIERTNKG